MLNNQRRAFLATTALIAPALAVAACTPGSATTAQVEQIIATTQAVLSYVSPIVPLLAAFVPGAAAFVPMVETGLSVAASIFNNISNAMTVAQTQPLIGQIATSIGAALDSADQATALITNPQAKATATAILAEARAILGLLTKFATGVAAVVTPPAPAMRAGRLIAPMHIRQVR